MDALHSTTPSLCFEYVERVSDWFEMKYDGLSMVKICMLLMILTHRFTFLETKSEITAVDTALNHPLVKSFFDEEEILEACDYARDVLDGED